LEASKEQLNYINDGDDDDDEETSSHILAVKSAKGGSLIVVYDSLATCFDDFFKSQLLSLIGFNKKIMLSISSTVLSIAWRVGTEEVFSSSVVRALILKAASVADNMQEKVPDPVVQVQSQDGSLGMMPGDLWSLQFGDAELSIERASLSAGQQEALIFAATIVCLDDCKLAGKGDALSKALSEPKLIQKLTLEGNLPFGDGATIPPSVGAERC